jgi:hypothetical protein
LTIRTSNAQGLAEAGLNEFRSARLIAEYSKQGSYGPLVGRLDLAMALVEVALCILMGGVILQDEHSLLDDADYINTGPGHSMYVATFNIVFESVCILEQWIFLHAIHFIRSYLLSPLITI